MSDAHAGPPGPRRRLRLAVWKLSSCDGCQLSLLDCEDELLELAEAVEIAHFAELSSAHLEGPYDLSLVEGSVSTAAERERIRSVRASSARLVAIGACATAGGIQALRNLASLGQLAGAVYAHPEYLDSLEDSSPVSEHVRVDYSLPGCPVDKAALVELLTAAVAGRRPVLPVHSVCQQCKAAGHTCLLVAAATPCLGPVTRAGCGALCPGVGRGCYGCFGPQEAANTAALSSRLEQDGSTPAELVRLFRSFNAEAAAFHEAAAAAEELEARTR